MANGIETFDWAVYAVTQPPGSEVATWAPIPQGSKAVVAVICSSEEFAAAVAGELTKQDWLTQHDEGRLFYVEQLQRGTPFNIAFSPDVLSFDPKVHAVRSVDKIEFLPPQSKDRIRQSLANADPPEV